MRIRRTITILLSWFAVFIVLVILFLPWNQKVDGNVQFPIGGKALLLISQVSLKDIVVVLLITIYAIISALFIYFLTGLIAKRSRTRKKHP